MKSYVFRKENHALTDINAEAMSVFTSYRPVRKASRDVDLLSPLSL